MLVCVRALLIKLNERLDQMFCIAPGHMKEFTSAGTPCSNKISLNYAA